jgi:uncharacterized protein YbbK (DUF523 family)
MWWNYRSRSANEQASKSMFKSANVIVRCKKPNLGVPTPRPPAEARVAAPQTPLRMDC